MLLEGLEIAEVKLSNIGEVSRIDPEFYRKIYLKLEQRLAKGIPLSAQLSYITDGTHVTPSYVESGVPFLSSGNIDAFQIDFEDVRYISEKEHRSLPHCQPRAGDVLVSKSGRIGHAAVVPDEKLAGSFNIYEGIALLRTALMDPRTLTALINSPVVQLQIERRFKGAAQPHLHLEDFNRLILPQIGAALSDALALSIREAEKLTEVSKSQLVVAEQTLLHALGLDTWRPPAPLTYVRRASEVAEAARFDSEFFAPRTLQLLAKLGAGGRTIRDVAPPRHEEFRAAGGPGEFDYIEIGSLRGDGTVGSERLACADAPSRATWHVRGGDVVTSTVRPNRRLSALITQEQTGFVASSGFVVLEPKAVSTEVLLTYLRLPPVCEVMDLHTSASLYPTISETDLLKLPFPKLDVTTCEKVTAAVRAAHAARRETQALLSLAQRAVEVAIEQGEPAALKILAQ